MKKNFNDINIIAYYLPQFHPVPENDAWWGKGFTEWTNVGKAKSLFPGHYQPRIPADLGYYDLRLPEVRKQQAELAKEAGISAFCYWHYWFGNGRQLLNEIIDDVIDSGHPDFPFCLGWANASWEKKLWNKDVAKNKILIEQTYDGEKDYKNHFIYALKAFKDKRYVLVDEKPLFMIYQPQMIPDISNFISLWNKWAIEAGLKGIYFVARVPVHQFNKKDDYLKKGFNAITGEGISAAEIFSFKPIRNIKRMIRDFLQIPLIIPYRKALKYFFDPTFAIQEDVIPALIPNWDHSPRSKKRAVILHKGSPKLFKQHALQVLEVVKQKKNKLIFLKSWNEWAEGNYMEPDLKFGKGYIKALREAIDESEG